MVLKCNNSGGTINSIEIYEINIIIFFKQQVKLLINRLALPNCIQHIIETI